MATNLADWVASPLPGSSLEPWITTAECVHRFNALYSSAYPEPRKAIPIDEYLKSVDDPERKRVMEIIEWQPPRHRWED